MHQSSGYIPVERQYLPEVCQKDICVVGYQPARHSARHQTGFEFIHTLGKERGYEDRLFIEDKELVNPAYSRYDFWGNMVKPWLENLHGIIEGIVVQSPEQAGKPLQEIERGKQTDTAGSDGLAVCPDRRAGTDPPSSPARSGVEEETTS